MIEINARKIKENEEFERASKNLPKNLILQVYRNAEPSRIYDRHDVNITFVPYNEKQLATSTDIAFYNNKVDWANFNVIVPCLHLCPEFANEPVNEIVFLYTKKIPKKYEYIDLYIQSHQQENTLRSCSIEFIDKDKVETLFSYTFEQKEMFANLSCGTFARVSNGWKFYPKFEVPNNTILQLNLSKQKGKS